LRFGGPAAGKEEDLALGGGRIVIKSDIPSELLVEASRAIGDLLVCLGVNWVTSLLCEEIGGCEYCMLA